MDFLKQGHISVGDSLGAIDHEDHDRTDEFEHGFGFIVSDFFDAVGAAFFLDSRGIVGDIGFAFIYEFSDEVVSRGSGGIGDFSEGFADEGVE
jgi:hypothetical protein